MKYSGVGGQAVMEGVMMKNADNYAVAVRRPDHEIEVKVEKYNGPSTDSVWRKVPIVRGVVTFVESLSLGMGTLMYSASFFEDEEPTTDKEKARQAKKDEKLAKLSKEEREKKEKREEKAMISGTVLLSIVMALALFFFLPYYLSTVFRRFVENEFLIAFIEGVIRLVLFIGYIYLISLTPDIKRVFMYHGAEHKCINCIEHGLALNVENVRKSSKEHKRCGTSFLIIVMLVSILFFMFIRVDSRVLRLVLRLLLIPVIAGVSYEFIRLAGRSDNWLVNALSKPGIWMQKITTQEPDDEMIEVGIASVEAVFDWEKWQKENDLS